MREEEKRKEELRLLDEQLLEEQRIKEEEDQRINQEEEEDLFLLQRQTVEGDAETVKRQSVIEDIKIGQDKARHLERPRSVLGYNSRFSLMYKYL